MMFWYDHGMNWWGYAGMTIGMVLFWTLIVVGIIALIRSSSNSTPNPANQLPPPTPHVESAEQLLAARFARGEIDETEYRQRLGVLRDHHLH